MTEAQIKPREMNGGYTDLHKTDKMALLTQNNNNNNDAVTDKKLAALKVERMSTKLASETPLNVHDGEIQEDASVLQRFYNGANVFVTGATGFMGKVLVEKLLRSCPGIENIYVMVREKKGRSLDERIDDLVTSPCFERIKKEVPTFRSKLHAVGGDIGLEGLGINDQDRQTLQKKVDIVFHVAATVRFDENLKTAILYNVRGTREVMTLCHSLGRLRAVVHVSTAYANCPSTDIDENLFESPLDSVKAIHMAETLDPDHMDKLTPTLIGKWPNSYAFTKAVSEDAVRIYGEGLPVAIFRPAVVVSTSAEPMAGWIDNMYGPTGVIAGVTAGLLRTMHCDKENEANIVPCDMVINGMLAAAWDVASNSEPPHPPVYNYVCPHDNPLTWNDFTSMYIHYGRDSPPTRAIWYWTMTMCSGRTTAFLCRLLLHMLPALIVDSLLLVANKKPQMIRVYNKIHRFTGVISYFVTRKWNFKDDRLVSLWRRLAENPRDRELFPFDMRALDWNTYIRDTCPGIRQFILRDSLETVPAAKRRMRWLYLLHRFTQCVLLCLLSWLVYLALSRVFSSYSPTTAHVMQTEDVL